MFPIAYHFGRECSSRTCLGESRAQFEPVTQGDLFHSTLDTFDSLVVHR